MHKKQIAQTYEQHTSKRHEDDRLIKEMQMKLEDEVRERRKLV